MITPIYDSNAAIDGYLGSRLVSSVFTLSANDTLTMDLAFLTNEGAPFFDYGIAALVSVPEPSTVRALRGCGRVDGRSRSHPTIEESGQFRAWTHRSAVSVAAVEGLEVAHVGREGRAEGVVVDGPARLVLGVPVAVLLDEPVEELEQVARRPQVPQGVLQGVVADGLVDEAAEARAGPIGPSRAVSPLVEGFRAGPEPVAGQVVE